MRGIRYTPEAEIKRGIESGVDVHQTVEELMANIRFLRIPGAKNGPARQVVIRGQEKMLRDLGIKKKNGSAE